MTSGKPQLRIRMQQIMIKKHGSECSGLCRIDTPRMTWKTGSHNINKRKGCSLSRYDPQVGATHAEHALGMIEHQIIKQNRAKTL